MEQYMAKQWAEKFYHSIQWKRVRAEVLHANHYTCSNCYDRGSEVHHIIELTPDNIDDENISLNPSNLKCLCGRCHKKITQGYYGDIETAGYIFNERGEVVPMPPMKI
jgi:5-methylcytosine-specific restriction endonuclease McrA